MRSDPPEGYVSSTDACRALRISPRTLRRRVQAGEIDGEYVARPQGTILYVRLPSGVAEPDGASGGDQGAPEGNAGQAAAQRLTVALDTVNRLVAQQAGLVSDARRLERENARLLETSQTHTRQHESDAETIRALRAERDAADERAARAEAESARLRARHWWRFWR